MPKYTSEYKHRLGRTEAMSRLRLYAGFVRGYSDLKGSWEDNVFSFNMSMEGMPVRARIQVEEDHLKLEWENPDYAPAWDDWLLQEVGVALHSTDPTFGETAPATVVEKPRRTAQTDGGPPTVLFLHIPKAGGSNLSNHIEQHCSAGKFRQGAGMFHAGILSTPDGFFKEGDLSTPRFLRPLLRRPDLRAVTGHFSFGLHEHVTRPWTYITMLREPVDRVVSLYYYLKLFQTMTLEEFAANPPFREIDNDQVRRVAGMDPELGGVTRETLETAKENLRRHFSVIGTTDRYQETLVLLNRRLGWTKELPDKKINANKDRKPLSALPESTVEALRAWNELDIELHRFATEWMDRAIEEEGPAFHDDLARRWELVEAR